MTRKTKIILLTAVVLGLILAPLAMFFYQTWWRSYPQESIDEGAKNLLTRVEITPGVNVKVEPEMEISAVEKVQGDIRRLAASFVERLGSYSNESDFGNIEDLRILMTAEMWRWAEGFIKESRSQVENRETASYYGITTKALKAEVRSFNEAIGETEVLVTTQRREAKGSSVNYQVLYQDIIVYFLKVDGRWLINGAYWQ